MNLYWYGNDNPFLFLDPYGLEACCYQVGLCTRNVASHEDLPEWIENPFGLRVRIPRVLMMSLNAIIPDHHNVRIVMYLNPDCAGDPLEDLAWGFFAESFTGAMSAYVQYRLWPWWADGYVPGFVAEQNTDLGECHLQKVAKEDYDRVKRNATDIGKAFTLYHLTKCNCQTWAFIVLNLDYGDDQ